MLDKLTELLTSWRGELNQLERDLEGKLQRLDYLQESPLPPDEAADIVIRMLTARGEKDFRNHLDQKLGHVLNNPLKDFTTTSWLPGLLSNIGSPVGHVALPQLFFILREPMSAAIREVITTWPDYPEPGPPRAQREKEVPKLERDIANLRERIEAQREAAKTAGLDVAELHARKPVPRRPRDLKRQDPK